MIMEMMKIDDERRWLWCGDGDDGDNDGDDNGDWWW